MSVHILIVADGRSPTTKKWLQVLEELGYTISLLSTFPCQPPSGLRTFTVLPVAFARFAGSQVSTLNASAGKPSLQRQLIARLRGLALPLRYRLGPLTAALSQTRFRTYLQTVQPDLVHALRIPYEGMLAAHTPRDIPFIVSIWGNDLTQHAYGSGGMGRSTRRTLARADGLAADTRRDIRLGIEWGFDTQKPQLVVPGSGGIDLKRLDDSQSEQPFNFPETIQSAPVLVVNPRGFRPGSVRNDTFFAAIPKVVEQMPEIIFACPAMQGQPEALTWVEKLGIQQNVVLLPYLPQEAVWQLFRRARLTVSISQHDGTPNSLLEAMACGCFPVAGNIESLREWIVDGENGLLVDPGSPDALAEALLSALHQPDLRAQAQRINRGIIEKNAEVSIIREKIRAFYAHFE